MAEKTLRKKILGVLINDFHPLEEISTLISVGEDLILKELSELLKLDLIKINSNGTYQIKENKEISIRLRMTKTVKNKWERFVNNTDSFSSVSGLIRYCVNGYLDGELQPSNQSIVTTRSQLQSKDKELNKELLTLNLKLKDMETHILKLSKQQTTKESLQLKNRILKQLKKAWYSLEEIADVLEIDESVIAEELADLLKTNAIEFNSKMEYSVKRG